MFDRKIILFNAIYNDKCSMNYAIELLKIYNFVDKIKFRREYSKYAWKKSSNKMLLKNINAYIKLANDNK
jgi:hypothetical protein